MPSRLSQSHRYALSFLSSGGSCLSRVLRHYVASSPSFVVQHPIIVTSTCGLFALADRLDPVVHRLHAAATMVNRSNPFMAYRVLARDHPFTISTRGIFGCRLVIHDSTSIWRVSYDTHQLYRSPTLYAFPFSLSHDLDNTFFSSAFFYSRKPFAFVVHVVLSSRSWFPSFS